MNWSSPNLPQQSRRMVDRSTVANSSGRMILELGLWIIGIALIAAYFLATTSLESERKQGLDLFSDARAAASVSHRLEDIPLPGQTLSPANGQDVLPQAAVTRITDNDELPIAVLRIDKVALEVPVYPDLSEMNMSRGAGWVGGTAAPNTGGNMAIAAHRDRYFRPLKDIEVGDTMELESLTGHGKYQVSRIAIVDPDDVSVLDDTANSTLTLVTCYPFYFIGNAPHRYIVQATAVDQLENASTLDAVLIAPPPGETP
ncbi:class D sortase [Wenzhouxiangella sp. EGI_FJ10305]|uniref:class D sortase n=1 Tax=Wenzhouxiangella sp. EGI_FJ10305 TaxID=3243768 RepID=UPI0035DC8B70